MSAIGRLWAGQLFGTNTGNLFAELENTDTGFAGLLRFMDNQFGVVVFDVTGTFDGSKIELKAEPKQKADGVEVTTITGAGTLTPEGNLRGQWKSEMGTGGTFVLFPHDVANAAARPTGLVPEQLYTAARQVGAVRLYASDVVELINFLGKDFSAPHVVVTYRERGVEISRYASDFQSDFARLGELRYIKLTVQEPEAQGINRIASIELNANGINEVRAQGLQESWVVGKAEALASKLRLHEKILSSTFRKFGLNANGLLALYTLAVLPDLTFARRIIFLGIVALVIAIIVQLHVRFIPNVAIYLSERKPSAFERAWPQILSWLLTVTSGLVAAIAYGLLKGELSDTVRAVLNWL